LAWPLVSDKFQPLGNQYRDSNCVNDLLLDRALMFPNNGVNSYNAAAVQAMMIPFSGTQYDENLPINTNRFKVHHHKVWRIRPTSAANTAVDVDPFNNVTGQLHRTFRFKIPTPKYLKWDRRDLDSNVTTANTQGPSNCGDPFVCWGYTPLEPLQRSTLASSLGILSKLRQREQRFSLLLLGPISDLQTR